MNDRFYVSNNSNLRIKIIRNTHDTSFDKHANKSFIYNKLSRHYYYFKIINLIAHYVKSYHIYKRSKIYRKNK